MYLGGAPSYPKSRRESCILLFPQQIFTACPLCDEYHAYGWAFNTKQTLSSGCHCQGSTHCGWLGRCSLVIWIEFVQSWVSTWLTSNAYCLAIWTKIWQQNPPAKTWKILSSVKQKQLSEKMRLQIVCFLFTVFPLRQWIQTILHKLFTCSNLWQTRFLWKKIHK